MNKLIIAFLLALFCMAAYGQTDSTKTKKRELSVYASVADHLTHDGIDSLKATLLRAADSSFVDTAHVESYKYDDKLHTYVDATVREAGKYLLRLEAKGYQTRFAPFEIQKMYKHESYRELKPIYLHRAKKQNSSSLGALDSTTIMDEVVVKATKLKFYMDGDTLVYDADAFSMAEGSMLDALIKKLPGVELKGGGEITVNGRKVDALLLNGKDFFDSDRELLLDNMPSYMVKDIRSYERTPDNVKGTIREKTTQKEMVMDVRLKRDYNTAWLANAEGGIGKRFGSQEDFGETTKAPPFLGRAFAMRYATNSRIALFANVNNLSDYRTPTGAGNHDELHLGSQRSLRERRGLPLSGQHQGNLCRQQRGQPHRERDVPPGRQHLRTLVLHAPQLRRSPEHRPLYTPAKVWHIVGNLQGFVFRQRCFAGIPALVELLQLRECDAGRGCG